MKKRKHPILFAKPDTGEQELRAIQEALESGWMTRGPRTEQFERSFCEFTGAKHALALNSATSALHLSLIASGVGNGDSILVPDMTFAATAGAVLQCGAIPLLVDVDPTNLLISDSILSDFIENQCTKKGSFWYHKKTKTRLKGFFGVDLAGFPCDGPSLQKIAKKYGLLYFSDAAHSPGAKVDGQPAGSMAHATSFSFYATKNITTGEGGMLTSNSRTLIQKARRLSLHGIVRRNSNPHWDYSIEEPGYKYNMNDLQAAMGLVQLSRYRGLLKKRKQIFETYLKGLQEISSMVLLPGNPDPIRFEPAYHLFSIQLIHGSKKERKLLSDLLSEQNIQTSVHFLPLHTHPFYKKNKDWHDQRGFPVSTKGGNTLLSLPLHTGLTEEEITRTMEAVIQAVKNLHRI